MAFVGCRTFGCQGITTRVYCEACEQLPEYGQGMQAYLNAIRAAKNLEELAALEAAPPVPLTSLHYTESSYIKRIIGNRLNELVSLDERGIVL